MAEELSNDNEAARPIDAPHAPDAHGQAAVLLVESLIHGLIARAVLSVEDAIEIVGVASEVNDDIAADRGDTPQATARSRGILGSIGASLKVDRIPK